jgi:hypothetical protein
MTDPKKIIIKSVLDLWNSRIKNADDLFATLSDEQLQKEVAPGKNRGIYLLGHVVAVHDKMLPLLGFEQQLYPQLSEPFLSKPDKTVAEIPSAQDLRLYWKNVNAKLAAHFSNLKTDEWFEKHTSVSAEDFIKEPHRNKLNVVMGRATHLAYHQGQVALLKK